MLVTQIVNRILNSNTWLLTNEQFEAWLVDCGDWDLLQSALPPRCSIKGIFLTHTHFDHIYGLNETLKKWPQCVVYTNRDGYEALLSDKKNFSRYYETSFIFEYPENVHVLNNGESFFLYDENRMNCFFTPGHDSSCICYEFQGNLFTGDSYIPNVKPVTNLRGGNKKQYQESLELIKNRMNICHSLFPGHGEAFILNIKTVY